jgi:catechol 2,3-dioxygenase-like lactoylglutathione lyase family enzyme
VIDHIGITVSSLSMSKAFYSSTLGALGYVLMSDTRTSISFGVKDGHRKITDPGGDFWLSSGVPMVPPVHFAFSAASQEAVDAFFATGIASGGIDNGAPRIRPKYHSNYYAAFLLDPDGYNIEAVCHAGTNQALATLADQFKQTSSQTVSHDSADVPAVP